MNYLVVSDIHGSMAGAKAFEDALNMHQPEAVLCLGDVLYHGPRNDLPARYAPKEVIPLMNRYASKISAVRGNCDAEVDQMVLNFPLTADYNTFLLGRRRVFMTHGHIYSPEHLPLLSKGDIFLFGHTHIPLAEETDGIMILNPGSISLPKQGFKPSYGLLSEERFTVYSAAHQTILQLLFD